MSTETETRLIPQGAATSAVDIFNPESANHIWKLAQRFSTSAMVPKHFAGKPEDVFIALEMAARLGAAPFQVLQNLYVVHGRPGWSAQFLIAMANASGKFDTPIMFEKSGEGKSLKITAYAIHGVSKERVDFTVSMKMADEEGWTKNPKYKSMPVLMLQYRAATFLVRTYCPEVTLGLHTSEELETIPAPSAAQEELTDMTPLMQVVSDYKRAGKFHPDMANAKTVEEVNAIADREAAAETTPEPEAKPEPQKRTDTDVATAAKEQVDAKEKLLATVLDLEEGRDLTDIKTVRGKAKLLHSADLAQQDAETLQLLATEYKRVDKAGGLTLDV